MLSAFFDITACGLASAAVAIDAHVHQSLCVLFLLEWLLSEIGPFLIIFPKGCLSVDCLRHMHT